MNGEFKTIKERKYNNGQITYLGDGLSETTQNVISQLLQEGYTIYDQYKSTNSCEQFTERNYILIKQQDNIRILND